MVGRAAVVVILAVLPGSCKACQFHRHLTGLTWQDLSSCCCSGSRYYWGSAYSGLLCHCRLGAERARGSERWSSLKRQACQYSGYALLPRYSTYTACTWHGSLLGHPLPCLGTAAQTAYTRRRDPCREPLQPAAVWIFHPTTKASAVRFALSTSRSSGGNSSHLPAFCTLSNTWSSGGLSRDFRASVVCERQYHSRNGSKRNLHRFCAHLTLETLSQPNSRLDPCGNPQNGLAAEYRFW